MNRYINRKLSQEVFRSDKLEACIVIGIALVLMAAAIAVICYI